MSSTSLSSLTSSLVSSSLATGSSTATGSTTSTSSTGSETTTISGTGILSSLGLGSGLDVSSIINALVSAAEAGPQQQITTQQTEDNEKVAGLTALQTSLTSVESALDELTDPTTWDSYAATLANSSVGTASVLSDATGGSYDVNVTQLATAQKRISDAQPTSTAIGSGTLTIGVGTNSMQISVASTDTLADIASKINSASGNPGVTASIISSSSGDQLVMTSTSTGVANGFTVSASSDSSSGLSSLATQMDTAGNYEAKDAELTIDGISIDSASNTVTGALTGVTLNLAATGSTNLTVAQDTSSITTAVNDFVDAYNTYAETVSSLDSYDSTTGSAGVLLGDQTLQAIQSQLSKIISSNVNGNSIGNLATLGITRNSDGTMSLDSDTLATALANNPSSVQSLFTGSGGLATQMTSLIDQFNDSSTGILQSRISALNDDLTSLSSQQTALNSRMDVYEQQLVKTYSNLDSLMTTLNNTSSYLTELDDAKKENSSS